jgi:hypothetical protein
MHLFIALAVALTLGVGTTAVAEYSQPGDALYTVKANVNDRVEAAVDPIKAEVRSFFNGEVEAEADAEANAEANAAGGTYLTADEGGEDADKMDTDLDASVETDVNAGVNLNL